MEVHHIMHHNPYDIVKQNEKQKISNDLYTATTDMLFGVTNFGIPSNFCTSMSEQMNGQGNNNNGPNKNCNGRSVAPDRKRPYPCNLCPSRFGSKMELEEHQNSHTGMKPFECDVCKARFNRRSTLWNHKRIHSDAKPFVCSVCQMTFKWKNSLKCHKEMHLRKNESSAHLENDLRQLTYATAAKRRLLESQEENGGVPSSSSSSIHNQPLITTTTSKKKGKASQNQQILSAAHLNALAQQPLQASALIPPSDHQLELDTTSLDSLVNTNHGNFLLQMYGDMDPRHATSMLSGLDDHSLVNGQLINDNQGKSESPLGASTAPLHFPMHINMFNFKPMQTQLPSVHHLTASTTTSLSSGSIDYSDSIAQPQYILTPSQPDILIGHQGLGGYQQQLDNCVILATQQDYKEYMPNYDFGMLSHSYQMGNNEQDYKQDQQQQQQQHQMQQQDQSINEEKLLPYDQW